MEQLSLVKYVIVLEGWWLLQKHVFEIHRFFLDLLNNTYITDKSIS